MTPFSALSVSRLMVDGRNYHLCLQQHSLRSGSAAERTERCCRRKVHLHFTVMMEDDEDFPPLEDADIDDVSSNASVDTDTSQSVSIESDEATDNSPGHSSKDDDNHNNSNGKNPHRHHQDHTVISKFNRMMETGIEEEHDEDFEDDDEDELARMARGHKRQLGPPSSHGNGEDNLGEPIIVPLKGGSDHREGGELAPACPPKLSGRRTTKDREAALERNAVRRQSSSSMLLAMQQAAREQSKDRNAVEPAGAGGEISRRAPSRTKSGQLLQNGSAVGGGDEAGPRRRPPQRTKSGGEFPAQQGDSTFDHTREVPAETYPDDVLISPGGRRRRGSRGEVDRETALRRNSARRQKSSELLGAMREATRIAPSRSQSSTAPFQRRPPKPTKSGAGLGDMAFDDECEHGATVSTLRQSVPVRRAPPRTKSGSILDEQEADEGSFIPLVPRRRPPERTKSGARLEPVPLLDSSA